MSKSAKLRDAILEYEDFLERGMKEEAALARNKVWKIVRDMKLPWDHLTLARHGMKSSIEEIRLGRVRNYSIGPNGAVLCHALTLVP